MPRLTALGAILFSLLTIALALPQQFCLEDEPSRTDICLAIASTTNAETSKRDLALHVSARFPDPRKGWAAFGVGKQMNGALMFIIYPGSHANEVTLSVRTANNWGMPRTLSKSNIAVPEAIVLRTWVAEQDIYNAQVMCNDCEAWSRSDLDLLSSNQTWIWAVNYRQETADNDVDLPLGQHALTGRAYMNMAEAHTSPESFSMPRVSTDRVSKQSKTADTVTSTQPSPSTTTAQPPPPPASPTSTSSAMPAPHQAPKHHTHSAFGVVSIHGFLLTLGFLLISTGVLVIRSGLASSFKGHWLMQTIAGGIIATGYLLGIYISFKHGGKFRSVHQWMGLVVVPAVGIQGLLGYYHHKNFLKYGSRTMVSYWHIWLGRGVLVMGNFNTLLGLVLSQASMTKFYLSFVNLGVQIAVLGPMWFFWSKGQTLKDVVTNGELSENYQSVEQGAFMLESDSDDDEAGQDVETNLKARSKV